MERSSRWALSGLMHFSVRPGHLLIAKEALEELHRAPNDGVRQLPAKRFARLVGIDKCPILRDLFEGERHTYPW